MALAAPQRWREVRDWFPRESFDTPSPRLKADYAAIRLTTGTCQTTQNAVNLAHEIRHKAAEMLAHGNHHPFLDHVRNPNLVCESILESCGLTRDDVIRLRDKESIRAMAAEQQLQSRQNTRPNDPDMSRPHDDTDRLLTRCGLTRQQVIERTTGG